MDRGIEPEVERGMREAVALFWPRPLPAPGSPCPGADRATRLENAIMSGFLAVHLSNVPTPANVAAAKAWRPAAAGLLDRWLAAWPGAFPEGPPTDAERWNERDGWHPAQAKWVEDSLASCVRLGDRSGLASAAKTLRRVETHVRHLNAADMRDWRAHVIDDAETFDALRHAVPGDTFVEIRNVTYSLVGHGDDGRPLLSPFRDGSPMTRMVLDRLRPSREIPYWLSRAFLEAAGRAFALCLNRDDCVVTLLAMARHGHRKAFLKGACGKSGTWTLDLSDVGTLADADVEMARVGIHWHDRFDGIIVQEHVPFRCEQRFFVVGGRIVASVCSDRNHTAADSRRDRILDERVALLGVPEIARGEFDRGATRSVVDRELSAEFARAARRIVRSIVHDVDAAIGGDFVLDMGLSDQGVLPIELNTLYNSGPYSLSRRRIVDARRKLAEDARRLAPAPGWANRRIADADRKAITASVATMPLLALAKLAVPTDAFGYPIGFIDRMPQRSARGDAERRGSRLRRTLDGSGASSHPWRPLPSDILVGFDRVIELPVKDLPPSGLSVAIGRKDELAGRFLSLGGMHDAFLHVAVRHSEQGGALGAVLGFPRRGGFDFMPLSMTTDGIGSGSDIVLFASDVILMLSPGEAEATWQLLVTDVIGARATRYDLPSLRTAPGGIPIFEPRHRIARVLRETHGPERNCAETEAV